MDSEHEEVADYFNTHWEGYKNYIANNNLYHAEMFQGLKHFLQEHLSMRPFSFVDVGCGDCGLIQDVLLGTSVKKYIGIDIAAEVLKTAPAHLHQLNCDKEFLVQNMTRALKLLPQTLDVIFSSYTVHHLSYQQKINFIHDCHHKLASGGFLLILDGVLEEGQTRDEWLKGYEDYYKNKYPNITEDELNQCLLHSRTSDFPETVSTFKKIAHNTGWSDFYVVRSIGLLVFMAFKK